MKFVTGRAVPNCQCKGQCPAIELTRHPYTAHRKWSVRLWANHQSEEHWLPEMKSSDGITEGVLQLISSLMVSDSPTRPVCGRLAVSGAPKLADQNVLYESTSGSSGWHRQLKRISSWRQRVLPSFLHAKRSTVDSRCYDLSPERSVFCQPQGVGHRNSHVSADLLRMISADLRSQLFIVERV